MLKKGGLPDHIRHGLNVLFVGINPGLRSARTGHHFAGHSNRFWKLLYESRMVTDQLTYEADWRLPDWKLGLTNIIHRPSTGIGALEPREYALGRKRLVAKARYYRPRIMAFLGVTIFRRLFPSSCPLQVRLGLQRQRLGGIRVFVLPNPSGRNAQYPYNTMLAAFRKLRKVAGSQEP